MRNNTNFDGGWGKWYFSLGRTINPPPRKSENLLNFYFPRSYSIKTDRFRYSRFVFVHNRKIHENYYSSVYTQSKRHRFMIKRDLCFELPPFRRVLYVIKIQKHLHWNLWICIWLQNIIRNCTIDNYVDIFERFFFF